MTTTTLRQKYNNKDYRTTKKGMLEFIHRGKPYLFHPSTIPQYLDPANEGKNIGSIELRTARTNSTTMKTTHRIYFIATSGTRQANQTNRFQWCPVEEKFLPDGVAGDEPIDFADLSNQYAKACAAAEDTIYTYHLKIETTLFLPIMEDEKLEELLDNTTATICTFPA